MLAMTTTKVAVRMCSGVEFVILFTWVEILRLGIKLHAPARVVTLEPRTRVDILGAKASRKIIHGCSLMIACVLYLSSMGSALHALENEKSSRLKCASLGAVRQLKISRNACRPLLVHSRRCSGIRWDRGWSRKPMGLIVLPHLLCCCLLG